MWSEQDSKPKNKPKPTYRIVTTRDGKFQMQRRRCWRWCDCGYPNETQDDAEKWLKNYRDYKVNEEAEALKAGVVVYEE